MFSPGLPGVGLLLLQASVAVALLLEHYAYRGALSTGVLLAVVLLSLVISVGYLTPIVTIIGLQFHALMWLQLGAGSALVAGIVCLDMMALAMLGPGAYLIDAYRFGRRVVVLPS